MNTYFTVDAMGGYQEHRQDTPWTHSPKTKKNGTMSWRDTVFDPVIRFVGRSFVFVLYRLNEGRGREGGRQAKLFTSLSSSPTNPWNKGLISADHHTKGLLSFTIPRSLVKLTCLTTV